MGRLKQIAALALALMLTATGCAQKPSTSSEANSSQSSSAATSSKTAGNRLVDKDTELTVMIAESSLVPISQEMQHFKWMSEQTGITIKFQPVPGSDYEQKKSMLISTNDLPDITQVGQPDLNNFAETGVFVDLSKYEEQLPNFYDKIAKYPESKFTFVDGKPYGFPTLCRWDMVRGEGLVIRKDILDELKLSIPTTFEGYLDMLRKFKEAYPDSTPYVNRNGSKQLMKIFGYSLGSGDTIKYDPQADKYLFQPAKPETKKVLTYLNTMYQEKLLDTDYVSVKGTQWEEKIAKGTGLSYLDNVNFAAKHLTNLKKNVPNAEWIVVPLPTNEFGYARGLYNMSHKLDRIWALSSSSKNIDAAIKYFNWFYTEEACDLMNLGREGEDYTRDASGNISFTNETLNKYRDESGNFVQANMHKDRGNAVYESFIPYSDMRSYFLATPDFQKEWYKVQQNDPAYSSPLPTPPFNAEEREKIAAIQTQLETIALEMFDKIIMGVEPIDSFESYVEKMKQKGLANLEKIYNDAYNRTK